MHTSLAFAGEVVVVHRHGHYRHHRHRHPRVARIYIYKSEEPPAAPEPPKERAPEPVEDKAHGGMSLSLGGIQRFGYVPLDGDMMAGGRLGIAASLPASGWLSGATLGLSLGMDVGQNHGKSAQVWYAGVGFALGAPWTHDIAGVGLEGGVVAGRYHDQNAVAYAASSRTAVPGPYGESFGLGLYGLGRLTLQVPLRGDVRPFLAGDLGVTQREDGRPLGILAGTGGLVWNAW
jgi:hypothetical protein